MLLLERVDLLVVVDLVLLVLEGLVVLVLEGLVDVEGLDIPRLVDLVERVEVLGAVRLESTEFLDDLVMLERSNLLFLAVKELVFLALSVCLAIDLPLRASL